jgi:RNA polymerase-binding transcription factor DksA
MAKKKPMPAPAPKKAKAAPPTAPKKHVTAPARKSKPAPAPKAEVKKENKSSASSAAAAKASAKEDLRSRIIARSKVSRPIAFSLDEAKEIAKAVTPKLEAGPADPKNAAKSNGKKLEPVQPAKPAAPNHVKAASLADIFGFNPVKKKVNPTVESEESIPERYRRYYKLLIELRDHVTGQLDTHTEETLKRSAKDDAGDLSSYGQHMADAGTDTFDRDFALSLVSNEQEALSEIDAAIQRIKAGTYGICEVTQKPIAKERLLAVPFTRYSAEAQKEIEKNRYRSRQQAGLFGEMGEDGAKIADEDAGGEE